MTDEPRKNERKTRGKPFEPGNPGKPKGARHKTTLLAEKLMSEDAEAIVKTVIEAAKSGDLTAARLVLDRIAPPRKANPIDIALPPLEGAEGIAAAHSAVIVAAASGELLLDEAMTLSSLLEGRRRALETEDLEKRIRRLEELKA